MVREHWSIETHHDIRDVIFSEDTAASRTGSGPANLATIRAAVIAAIKDAGYLHVPKAAATTPPPPKPSTSTASIRTETHIHGTRRSPGAPGSRHSCERLASGLTMGKLEVKLVTRDRPSAFTS